MTSEIQEVRRAERYLFPTPPTVTYAAGEVTLVNISSSGVQIRHPMPIRIGSGSRLTFRIGSAAFAGTARVIWSHLVAGQTGKPSYHSGLRIDDVALHEAIDELRRQGDIAPDVSSLERKKQRVIEREREKMRSAVTTPLNSAELSDDHRLLIRRTHERLLANPDESSLWQERARMAIRAPSSGTPPHVLAVWAFLEQKIEINAIARVLEAI